MCKSEDHFLEAKKPSAESMFYVQWARESMKANIGTANEALKQLIALNASLAGGSILFLQPVMLGPFFRYSAYFLFLAALIVAFLGFYPRASYVDTRSPRSIRIHKESSLKTKLCFLRGAALLMFMGFIAIIVGVIARAVWLYCNAHKAVLV